MHEQHVWRRAVFMRGGNEREGNRPAFWYRVTESRPRPPALRRTSGAAALGFRLVIFVSEYQIQDSHLPEGQELPQPGAVPGVYLKSSLKMLVAEQLCVVA